MNAPRELPAGWRIEVRPIRAEDEAMWVAFMRAMSWATRYKRGARRIEHLTEADVKRAVRPVAGKELAFVAVATRGDTSCVVGVSRGTFRKPDTCEFMLVVGDDWQGCGIGARLMQALMDAAARSRHPRIVGRILATNGNMLDFVRHLGFELADEPGDPKVRRAVRVHAAAGAAAAS